jgi:hypothetical protein
MVKSVSLPTEIKKKHFKDESKKMRNITCGSEYNNYAGTWNMQFRGTEGINIK